MPAIDTDQTGGGTDFGPSDVLIRFRATHTNETDPGNDIYVYHINGGTGSKLVFQDSGSLYSFGTGSALWLETNIDVTVNAGSTISGEKYAVELTGSGKSLSLTNFGKIHCDDTAIYVNSSGGYSHHLINYGEISGPTAYADLLASGSTIDNWGTMVGQIFLGDGDAVNNYGTIVGQVELYSGVDTVFNSGTMRNSVIAITSLITTGSGNKTITNAGVIESTDYSGDYIAIKLFDGDDRLINSGTIHGRVDLGDGSDSIVNAGVFVNSVSTGAGADSVATFAGGYFQGVVLLEAGVDLFNGSDLSDVVFGGADADNIITYAGDDILGGGDQSGPDAAGDKLAGGTGSDTYFVAAGDAVVENVGEGNDRVSAYASYTLTAGAEVERLEAITAGITLTGNAFVQTITGKTGNETLSGGGNGDTLIGLAGNDTYALGATTATIVEQIGGGTADLVTSTISRSLASYANVEKLTLLNVATAIGGTGNTLANIITGNNFNNVLNGGLGNDTLNGGLGNDTFVFNTLPNTSTNRDTIDFRNVAGNNDSFQLDNAVFTKLGANGALNPLFFKTIGSSPLDPNDFIQYNQATGTLIYDTNGNGAGGGIVFATLINKPVLTAADFTVI